LLKTKGLKRKLMIRYIVPKIFYKKMAKDNLGVLFRRKPALMLIALKKSSKLRYGSLLAKEVDCTYSHAVKILQCLQKLGIIGAEKQGRIKLVKLTRRGLEVANYIEKVKELMS